jgi:hypothetical protein
MAIFRGPLLIANLLHGKTTYSQRCLLSICLLVAGKGGWSPRPKILCAGSSIELLSRASL